MSAHLIEKLKKSRETQVEAGGKRFTVRRPTDLEVMEMRGQALKQGDIMERFVIGWPDMQEIDIIPGGSAVPVPFSTELFMEWVADKAELWAPLTQAILSAYEAHQTQVEEQLKKPGAG
jgi:hypothetical protein